MLSFSNFIKKQSKLMLENKHYAICCVLVFAVLPFASWLSVTLVALVTLRKGEKSGFDLLLPALVFHSVPLMMLVSVDSALINTLMTYLPCYLAAITLRKTMNWQIVCGVFLLQALLGVLLFQGLAPDFIVEQFTQFKMVLSQYHGYQPFASSSNEGLSVFVWSQLFFGTQIVSVVISSLLSLLFARSIQARLFFPGAFKRELLAFRSGRIALLVFLGVSLGAYYEVPLALNLLFLVICYFLAAGFSLAYFVFARKRPFSVTVLLILLIILKPSMVLSAYVIMGSLDSVFNFRLYLPTRVKKST